MKVCDPIKHPNLFLYVTVFTIFYKKRVSCLNIATFAACYRGTLRVG